MKKYGIQLWIEFEDDLLPPDSESIWRDHSAVLDWARDITGDREVELVSAVVVELDREIGEEKCLNIRLL